MHVDSRKLFLLFSLQVSYMLLCFTREDTVITNQEELTYEYQQCLKTIFSI